MAVKVERFHGQGSFTEPIRIKVERGQQGGYAFEVSLAGPDETKMITKIKEIYVKLDAEFCQKGVA
jgi:lysylphosphatidylglycerol synthetase-like protein (DUF2156 family)